VRYVDDIDEVCEIFNWVCHAHCLMGNHYHLLIETPEGNLSKGMRQLNGVYTQVFNRQHRRVGHVYQGRYRAILVAEGRNQPSPWEQLKNQVYLGRDQFVDEMQRRIDGAERLSEIPSSQRRPLAKPLQSYVESASSRDQAINLVYASGGYSLSEIGDFFGLHYSRVSRIVRETKPKT